MGQTVSMPVVILPTGVQAVHPEGELAVARAAAARGTAICLSSFASKPVEEVAAAQPEDILAALLGGPREQILDRCRAGARPPGAVGLIVTLDWSFSHGRDWGSPTIAEQLNFRTSCDFRPARHSTRPRWLLVGADGRAARL